MDRRLLDIKINWYKVGAIYNDLADRHMTNNFTMRIFHLINIFEKDCTQKKISEITGAPKQSVNNVIQDFIDKDYITVVTNPKDKRYKLLKVTKKGKLLYKATIAKIEDAEMRVLSHFSNDEIEAFINFYKKYNELLEKETEEI